MLRFKQILFLFCLTLSSIDSSQAAFNMLSIHSRANCINNESISWDATHYWVLATESWHYLNGTLVHLVGSGWATTWRSAGVHWGEGRGGYQVIGYHHIWRDGAEKDSLLGTTNVKDCSIYNGWWEAHPP
jgi:hypothetical protein